MAGKFILVAHASEMSDNRPAFMIELPDGYVVKSLISSGVARTADVPAPLAQRVEELLRKVYAKDMYVYRDSPLRAPTAWELPQAYPPTPRHGETEEAALAAKRREEERGGFGDFSGSFTHFNAASDSFEVRAIERLRSWSKSDWNEAYQLTVDKADKSSWSDSFEIRVSTGRGRDEIEPAQKRRLRWQAEAEMYLATSTEEQIKILDAYHALPEDEKRAIKNGTTGGFVVDAYKDALRAEAAAKEERALQSGEYMLPLPVTADGRYARGGIIAPPTVRDRIFPLVDGNRRMEVAEKRKLCAIKRYGEYWDSGFTAFEREVYLYADLSDASLDHMLRNCDTRLGSYRSSPHRQPETVSVSRAKWNAMTDAERQWFICTHPGTVFIEDEPTQTEKRRDFVSRSWWAAMGETEREAFIATHCSWTDDQAVQTNSLAPSLPDPAMPDPSQPYETQGEKKRKQLERDLVEARLATRRAIFRR